jgi:putative NADPH-quinone reductase
MESIVQNLREEHAPLVLACSPRKGGNSDFAADLIVRGLKSAGAEPRLFHLRDLDLLPCLGCQTCGKSAGNRCVLMDKDQSEMLFQLILASPMLFLASPIYFYHLPASFKGFIDRAQRYYEAKIAGDPGLETLKPRQAHVCLVAGRPKGERLFEGSLLTLRYFLWPFNVTLAEPLCLPGVDRSGDLDSDSTVKDRVVRYAFEAWQGAGR